MIGIVAFIVGIAALFRGSFRLAGRDIPRPIGRAIGALLMVPLSFEFLYTLTVLPSMMSAADEGQVTLDMNRFTESLNGLVGIQLVLLVSIFCIIAYLVYNSPRSDSINTPRPMRPPTAIKPTLIADPDAPRAPTPWDRDETTEFPDPFDVPAQTEAERGIKPPVARPMPTPIQSGRPHPLEGEGGQRKTVSGRNAPKSPTIMTPKEAGDYLHLPEAEVMALIEGGKLAAARGNGGYRIARIALDDYLADKE